MKKDAAILVTGATGFTGSYIVRALLAAGYENIYGLRRENSSLALLGAAAEQIQWCTADLTDYFAIEDAIAGISVVVHCAALVSFQSGDKDRLLEVNRGGTRHVVNAALHHQVDHLVYLSSVAALGRNEAGQVISEQSKWEEGPNVTNYSRSKFLAELEVWRGQAEGLSVSVLYPSIILGAGHWQQGSIQLFDYVAKAPTYYPAGTTGVVDVRDVAEAAIRLLERQQDSDRFLLNGSNISYQALLGKIAQAFGRIPPQRQLPFFWAIGLARLEQLRAWLAGSNALLSPETVRAAYQRLVYDSSHSENVLGLNYHSLEETISDTVALYQQTQQEGYGLLPVTSGPSQR